MEEKTQNKEQKKQIKTKPLLFLIILCIILLIAGISLRIGHGQNLEEIFSSSKVSFNPPQTMDLNTLLGQGEIVPKEFISPDGKLKVDYTSDWQESQEGDLKELSGSLLEEKAKFIFLARKININEKAVALFIIQETEKENKSLSEIIEMMKEKDEKMEIINSEIKEKEATMELIYKREPSFQSKERLLLNDQKIYLIAFLTLEKDWGTFKEETEKILASARIVE